MPKPISFDDNDLQSVALCAWKEARGEVAKVGIISCVAVECVIANRARSWSESLHSVVYGKNQFTSMSVPSDPEFNLMPAPDDDIYSRCLLVAKLILAGTYLYAEGESDPTSGALYYWNPRTADADGWFARNIANNPAAHPLTATIGDQQFYA